MNRSDQPAERPDDDDVLDPAQFDGESSDVGGPASALGTGVESALTGGVEPESGDEGRASSQPQPAGD
ncbi:MAG: hypothetical protein ACJ74U_16280 [Jatrophihabitantaceae bacterium]